MQRTTELNPRPSSGATSSSRLLISLIGLLGTLALLYFGFIFLRSNTASQLVVAIVAILWGVGGVAMLFTTANMLVESLPDVWQQRIQPYIFAGPAIALLSLFLAIPTVLTFYQSFFDAGSTRFVGLANYIAVFTDRLMLQAFRNNLIWLVMVTSICVILGLLIAVLADRSKFETIAKALIFMPMAISFVGAGIIFRFIYAYAPAGEAQIGLFNAVVTSTGGQPVSWLTTNQPWNNIWLMLVLIWMQTGFGMVIFSAALKGVPDDIVEAARMDGATELQAFFRIIIPYIMGTIITVATTTAIFTLKIFDVVVVMTGGQYGTEVVATQFYRQFFTNRNFGFGAAIAMVLFFAVLPVMFYNLRQLRKQEGF
jgi:alpha-glucoside transport system permease protein